MLYVERATEAMFWNLIHIHEDIHECYEGALYVHTRRGERKYLHGG